MDIFVISLESSQDRKADFDKNNKKYLKNYQYHSAVNGKNLNVETLDKTIITKGSKMYSNGAIGCALSHLQLWEKCIELDKPIIVMEDDVIVSQNFTKHVNNIMSNLLPKNWDILQLSYNFDSILSYNITNVEKCNCVFEKTQMTKTDIENFVTSKINTTIAKLNHCFGSSAYIISPSGAKIFKQKCFPLCNKVITLPFLNNVMCSTIDGMMNSAYKDVSAYVCIAPFVITQHINEAYKSTIE